MVFIAFNCGLIVWRIPDKVKGKGLEPMLNILKILKNTYLIDGERLNPRFTAWHLPDKVKGKGRDGMLNILKILKNTYLVNGELPGIYLTR